MAGDDDPVPKLPRGRGFKLSMPEIFRIALTGGMLVAVLVLAKPCSDAVSKFVMRFDGSGSAHAGSGSTVPATTQPTPQHYERLHPGMTDEETKAAIERARANAGSRSPEQSAGTSDAAGASTP
jgi:hypothetical protein